MNEQLIQEIISRLREYEGARDYNWILTELANRIYRLSGNRTEYFQIMNRIMDRADPTLNTEEGSPIWSTAALVAPEIFNAHVMAQVLEDQTFFRHGDRSGA